MASKPALKLFFLRVSHIKRLNKIIEGANSCVLDENMLESAVNSPINQQHYGQENDLARLAAALSCKLIKNHSFGNGNKRTALLAANFFLLQNGKMIQQDPCAVEANEMIKQAHADVAMGKIEESELAEIYRRLWQNATQASHTQAATLYDA